MCDFFERLSDGNGGTGADGGGRRHESYDCATLRPRERFPSHIPTHVNCKGDHSACSRSCFFWKQEKKSSKVKVSENISIPDARKRLYLLHKRTLSEAVCRGLAPPSVLTSSAVGQKCRGSLPEVPPQSDVFHALSEPMALVPQLPTARATRPHPKVPQSKSAQPSHQQL